MNKLRWFFALVWQPDWGTGDRIDIRLAWRLAAVLR